MSDLDAVWTWAFSDQNGEPAKLPDTVPTPAPFASQSDAETWIGENWRELLDNGVASVTLQRDGQITYSMGLDPA
jgi:hypothetical protein